MKYDRGGGWTRRKVKRPPNQRADPGMTLNVSIDYAETRWVLKVVESDISYLAMKISKLSLQAWIRVLRFC